MDTTLSKDIENYRDKIRYDEACRKILSDKQVLAWILKGTLKEYQQNSIEDILPCIESPVVGKTKIEDTNAPERIIGISDNDKSLYEGNIYYDIKFSATVKDTLTNLIINIEEQNNFYPGYPILKRASYYCGRMISAQKGTIFTNDDYDKLQKVISIWICPNPSKEHENTILSYAMQEEKIFGDANHKREEYDLTNIVLVNLGNPEKRTENDVLKLLAILLSTEIEPKNKKQILEDDFNIPMTNEMQKEAEVMCNLSYGIEQRGIEKGIEKGKIEMVIKMLKSNQPLELIKNFSEFSKEKILNIAKQQGIIISV